MSPSEAKRKHSSTDFLIWEEYFDREWNERSKEDYRAARICFQIYLLRHTVATLFVRNPPAPELTEDKFLLEFETKKVKDTKPSEVDTKANIEMKTAQSKSAWMSFLKANEGRTKAPPKE
jgi:hypothetical protein